VTLKNQARFEEAIRQFDAANSEDPRTELVDGFPQPRELMFSRRVYDWVLRLDSDASEVLLLAARAHTLRRWMIPRDQYPKTTPGYHMWRNALAKFHAEESKRMLEELSYDADTVSRVFALILRTNFPADPDSRTLEDADCLVFLETKLQDYVEEWGKGKTLRILRQTLSKMTPTAASLARELQYHPEVAAIMKELE
jgi:hypothetical protein